MRTRQLGKWIVASASVAIPLGVVLLSLRYQAGLWPVAALATAAAVAVALAEVAAREGRGKRGASGEEQPALQPVRLRRLDHEQTVVESRDV